MREPYRISVVSYLNSKPYVAALSAEGIREHIVVSGDIPALCAQKLRDGLADAGLVPAAILPALNAPHLICDFGIAADGVVDSVIVVSNDPLTEIKRIFLDKESRTSVALTRILAEEWWQIQPEWIPEKTEQNLLDLSKGDAAVIIGDRALRHRHQFTYVFDLAGEWKQMTGLPFVFAVWAGNGTPDEGCSRLLEKAFIGLENIPAQLIRDLQREYPYVDVEQYLIHRIKYRLGGNEKAGLELFLEKNKKYGSYNTKNGSGILAVI